MLLRILDYDRTALLFAGNHLGRKSMNEDQKKIVAQNVEYLCSKMEGVQKGTGGLNVKAAADKIGIGQTTLMRIIKGENKQLRPETEAKLQAFFKLSKDDIYNPDLMSIMTESRVDRITRMIEDLSPEEVLELRARMPGARIVLE